jgi:uncharacterized protein
MQIKPIGTFLETDSKGYIVNPTSKDKLQKNWIPVIDDITNYYVKNYGDKLKGVYLRGSVAKGTAIEYVSDIDTFAMVDLSVDKINNKWTESAEKHLKEKFSFITGAEMAGISTNSVPKNILIILNQSLLVQGTHQKFPKMKISKDLAIHAPNIEKRLGAVKENLAKMNEKEEIEDYCAWIMKGYLRIGLEILIEKTGKYSRDLYPCYKLFSEYYPKKEKDMREVLVLAIQPTADKDRIERISSHLGEWLLSEAKKVFS